MTKQRVVLIFVGVLVVIGLLITGIKLKPEPVPPTPTPVPCIEVNLVGGDLFLMKPRFLRPSMVVT
jgi:hypothetical protein